MRNRFSECHNTLDPTVRCATRVLQDWTTLCAFTGENTLATLLQALLYLRVDDAVDEIVHYVRAELEEPHGEIQDVYSTCKCELLMVIYCSVHVSLCMCVLCIYL